MFGLLHLLGRVAHADVSAWTIPIGNTITGAAADIITLITANVGTVLGVLIGFAGLMFLIRWVLGVFGKRRR